MTIKLYGDVAMIGTSRAIATFYEKEVEDWELIPIDLEKGEHKTPEYLKLNPWGVVPVLVHGDFVLYESRAIARAIATKYEGQGTPLYGSSPKDRALVDQWLEVEGQNFEKPISDIMWQLIFGPKFYAEATDEALLARQVAKLESVFDVYEKQLSTTNFLAGDFFSLADLSHLPYMYYLMTFTSKTHVVESRPALKAWWERISSRPAWKKWVAMLTPQNT